MGYFLDKTTNYIIRRNYNYLPKYKQDMLISLKDLYSRSSSIHNRMKDHRLKTNTDIHRSIIGLANNVINEFNDNFTELYEYITEGYQKERTFPPSFYIQDLLNRKKMKLSPPHKIKIQSFLLSMGLTPQLLKEQPQFIGDAVKVVKSALVFMIKFSDFKKRFKDN